MADKTTTTIIALAALTAGAIGGSTLLPAASATEVDVPEYAEIVAEGGDLADLRSAAAYKVQRMRAIKRAKVIGVLDWIRVNKPAVWAQIMAAVQANWDNAYPPPEPEPVEPK
jgi:hypothetical protein